MASGYYSGYVHKMLDENQDFPAFVWSVARGFGAFVTLRDDMGAKLPLAFEPNAYYTESLAKAIEERDEWYAKTADEKIAWGENERQNVIIRRQASLKTTENEMARLSEMRAQVEAWEPPTTDHTELKKSMLQSIDSSTGNGDPTEYDRKAIDEATAKTALQFAAEHEAKVDADVAYHAKALAEEIARVESRNAWIAALNESVPLPKPTREEVPA